MIVPPRVPIPPADSIRAALKTVLANREYVWVETPDPWRGLRELWQRFLFWLQKFGENHPVGRTVLVIVLVLVLVAILAHAAYVVRYLMRAKPDATGGPVGGPRTPADVFHLQRARELAAAGRYAEAMGHRFTAMLLRLDRRQVLRFHISKTPAEYLEEPGLPEPARLQLGSLIATLYRHAFAGVPGTPEDWDRFEEAASALA